MLAAFITSRSRNKVLPDFSWFKSTVLTWTHISELLSHFLAWFPRLALLPFMIHFGHLTCHGAPQVNICIQEILFTQIFLCNRTCHSLVSTLATSIKTYFGCLEPIVLFRLSFLCEDALCASFFMTFSQTSSSDLFRLSPTIKIFTKG